MAKFYLEIITPGNGNSYELQVDSAMIVCDARKKVIDDIIEVESGNIALDTFKTRLYSVAMKTQLDDTVTLSASGIHSGHKLLLL